MKKIMGLLMTILMAAMGMVIWQTGKREEAPSSLEDTAPPQIRDTLILQQDQINGWIQNAIQDRVTDLKVDLKEEGVEISFVLDEKLNSLIDLEKNPTLASAVGMFAGERISCEIALDETMRLNVNHCQIGSFPIPSSVYSEKVDQLNEQLPQWLETYGIEEVAVFEESVEIQGDISKALDQLVK